MAEGMQSSIMPPQLLNECRNCKMRFDNAQSLANHVKKFCTDSTYANVNQLEQRLQELGHKQFDQNLNFNFEEVKNYMKGDGNQANPNAARAIGKMNLEDMRNYFQSEGRKFEDISKQAVRAKERELIDELQDMKKERNFLKQQRMEQDKAMHDLIKDLELRKERELRAKLEKEEIQRNLKQIEQTKTSALERDKRKELERLAAERENLRLREEEIMDEIRNLEAKSYEQERKLKEEREQKQQKVEKSQYFGQVIRRKEVDMAKQRGEEIATLQQKKDMLERDRQRIMDDLERVKNGDMSGLRRNEASRWVANDIIQKGGALTTGVDITRVKLDPIIKDRLVTDQVRINHLKEQREKMLRDAQPELDELDAMTREWLKPNARQQNQMARSMINMPAGPVSQSSYPSPMKSMALNKGNNFAQGIQSDDDVLEKLRQLREEYSRDGQGDPQFFAQLDDLENHLVRKQEPIDDQNYQEPEVQNHQEFPPFMAPPMMGPGAYPPPMFPPMNQQASPYPINFYPTAPLQPPAYIPPPPPNPTGAQHIERYEPRPEPQPQYIQPYLNPQIEAMNKVIKEQEIQNELLESQLHSLKQGAGSYQAFDSLIGNTNQDLAKIKQLLGASKLKGKGGTGNQPFPEDFVFRQNEFRCEDLEVEERAMMNVAAQEYDALRVLAKLPVNSELYRYKMDQYKELSTMRAEIEKVLQEQKLEKIRRDFEKQKYEDERRFKHEKWLEDQKRQILEAKLKNAGREPPKPNTAQYYPQQQQQQQQYNDDPYDQPRLPSQHQQYPRQPTQSSSHQIPPPLTQTGQNFFQPPPLDQPGQFLTSQQRPATSQQQQSQKQQQNYDPDFNPNEYKPERGFNIFYDFASRVQRQFRSMRIVYAVYNVSRPIIPPCLIDVHDGEPDPEDQERNRVIFRENNLIKNIQPHPSANLIIELQVPKPGSGTQPDKYVSYGWTILNLFDVYYELNRGIFKLPIYMSPTKTDIDVRDIPWLKRIPEVIVCMRLGNPDDENSRFDLHFHTSPDEYVVPKIHQLNYMDPKPPEKEEEKIEPPPKNKLEPPPIPKQERQLSQYECKGVNVQLHYLKQYVPSTHARVQCTLYDGAQIVKTDDLKQCNWASKPVDAQNIVFTRADNPQNVGLSYTPSGLARGEILAVEDETTWIRDLYKLQIEKGRTQDLNLVFQIMEYSKGRNFNSANEVRQEYTPVGYGVLKLNNPDGTIRYGTYDVEFFKLPVNLTQRSQVEMLRQSMKVTLSQPPFQNNRPQQPRELREQQQPPEQKRPELQIEPNDDQAQPNRPGQERPFIPNELKQYDEQRWMDGQGIDFYVDGARFLPENVTYSRILVRAFTIDQYRVINPTKGLADLEVSRGRHPFYGFRQEIRAPKIDPTLMMLITVETIDRSDGLEKIAGYAYFPLFLNGQTKTPISQRNMSNLILQSGSYQIPLYFNKVPVDQDITFENIQTLEKIPCASILIRCSKAPIEGQRVLTLKDVPMDQWRQKGLIIDPPDYQDGVYNTTYCSVSAFERELFDLKQRLCQNDDQLMQWLDQKIVTNPQTPNINMKYFSAYDPKLGFTFVVERLHGLQQRAPHIVISSVAPPYSLYRNPPKRTQDVSFFTDFTWDGPWNSPQFNEQVINYAGLAANLKLGFIFDVKVVRMSGSMVELKDFGWAYLSIFDLLDNEDGSKDIFTNSGLHAVIQSIQVFLQLPIYSGSIPVDLIEFACQSPNPGAVIRRDSAPKIVEFASVIVRLADNQRIFRPPKAYFGDIENTQLPQDRLMKFALKEQRDRGNVESGKQYMPSGMQKEQYEDVVFQAIKQRYKL